MRLRTLSLLAIASFLLLGVSQLWLAWSVADRGLDARHPVAVKADAHAAPSLIGSVVDLNTLIPAPLNHSDIPADYRDLWSDTLKSLPPDCQSTLSDVYVQFNRPAQRGMSGDHSIILYAGFDLTQPEKRDEARALFVHEYGHVTDLGCLTGVSPQMSAFRDGEMPIPSDDPSVVFYSISWLDSQTRRPDSQSDDFVSGYAASDPFEDFAETYAYFALQEPAFAARAQQNPVIKTLKYTYSEGY
jgi:hypothetical protein